MADGVGDDAVSRAHRHRRESEGLSVADLLARHGRDATTPGHRHQQPDEGMELDGGPRGRSGSVGPITAPNLPAPPYGGYLPEDPPERYSMDGPTGRYPLVDRLSAGDPYPPTASGPSGPVPMGPDDPPSSFAEFDAEPPPDEPRGAIWSTGQPVEPAGWPVEPEERPSDPFRSPDRGRSAVTDSRPSPRDSMWSSPNPSTNLFAQLGSAEPDERPTEVVPRVDDGPSRNGVPGGSAPGVPGGVPGGPAGDGPGAYPGAPAGGVAGAVAGGAALGAAAAGSAVGGVAGAAGGVAGAAGTVALGAVAGTAAIRPSRHHRPDAPDPDGADPGFDEPADGERGYAGPPTDRAEPGFAQPPSDRAEPGFAQPPSDRAEPGFAQPPSDRAGTGASGPSADRAEPAAGEPEPGGAPGRRPGLPAHEEYDPSGGGGAEEPAVVNAPPVLTQDQRTRQIDASLTRLTAIHAGLGAELSQRVSRRSGDEEDKAADAEADEPTDDGPPPPSHPTLNRVARIAALVVAAAMFVLAASGWGMQAWLDTKLRTVTALDADADTVVDAAAQQGDRNYLFVGLPPGGHEARPAAVTLVHLDSARERLVLVGFPENLVVDRPSCDRWDNTGNSYPGGTTPAAQGIKLFEAYAEGGPRCLTKTVQKLTGLSVNHYTGLDLGALPAMVDAVHGVPLCQALAVSPGPAPEGGPTVLTGDKALAFVRGAGDPTDRAGTGDADSPAPPADADDQLAIRHQQVFLAALLNKATSDGVLNSPSELNALVSAFGGASYEDNADLAELTPLAKALHRIEPAKVLVVTAPPAVPSGRPGEVDPGALYAAIRADKPLPGETVADKLDTGAAKPDPALIPSSIRVTVRNASKKAGLANEAAESLRTLGFVVAGTGDAPPSPGGRTIIRYSPDRAKQAAVLGDAVPSAIVEPAPPPPGSGSAGVDSAGVDSATGLDEPRTTPTPPAGPSVLELVLGDRFDGQVRVAPAPQPTAGASVASLRAATHTAPTCG